jgi:hemerythrin
MDRIEWDQSLETGDPVVDLQHRAIHDIFNRLYDAKDDSSQILGTLDFLTQHVIVHFATEEDLMPREEFPVHLTEVHVAEHRQLTEGVRMRVLEYRQGSLDSTAPILELLHKWLISHVNDCDRVLVEHIRARGVTAELPDAWSAIGDSPLS